MEILYWVVPGAFFAFLALGVFGRVAAHTLPPTPFRRFCAGLWTRAESWNLKLAKLVMLVMLALLAAALIAGMLIRLAK